MEMKILVTVTSRVVINPPGVGFGKYVEVTTETKFPVSLNEQVLPMMPPPPSIGTMLFGPVSANHDIEQIRQELESAERSRITSAWQHMINGC